MNMVSIDEYTRALNGQIAHKEMQLKGQAPGSLTATLLEDELTILKYSLQAVSTKSELASKLAAHKAAKKEHD